jgi:ABC-type Fe2+-enterobactin transport system substrate-binding protein
VNGGGDVIRSAREAKEQLKSQTGVVGECEITIHSLDRKLVDVREQVQNAQQKIDGLKVRSRTH